MRLEISARSKVTKESCVENCKREEKLALILCTRNEARLSAKALPFSKTLWILKEN